MKRQGLLVVAAIAALSACEGALTAHVDTVAKAGSNELSIERLGSLLGGSAQIPIQGAQGREVVPVSFSLEQEHPVMVISGANAGGIGNNSIYSRVAFAALPPVGTAVVVPCARSRTWRPGRATTVVAWPMLAVSRTRTFPPAWPVSVFG